MPLKAQIVVEDAESGRTYYADVAGEIFEPSSTLSHHQVSERHLVPALWMLRDAIVKARGGVRREIVPNNRAADQSDQAKTYQCHECKGPIFSQYEGEEQPRIHCGSLGHVLEWWP